MQVTANPLYAWWRDENQCLVACENGAMWSYELKDPKTSKLVHTTVNEKKYYSIPG